MSGKHALELEVHVIIIQYPQSNGDLGSRSGAVKDRMVCGVVLNFITSFF